MADSNIIYEYRKQIEAEVERQGSFSHNIIGIVLRQVSEEFSVNVANGLVDEYELDEIFGIQKVSE